MQLIQYIIKQFYLLIILLSCVGFVLWIFFSDDDMGKNAVLEAVGKIYMPMMDEKEQKNNGLNFISSTDNTTPKTLIYTKGVQNVGAEVNFRDMFSVKEDSEFVIRLIDIKSCVGQSVLAILSTEEIENLQEITAAFIYDKELDILYFHKSGIYLMYVELYGIDGRGKNYEFKLPVEAG